MTSQRNDFTGVRFTTVLLIRFVARGARTRSCQPRARMRRMGGRSAPPVASAHEAFSIQAPGERRRTFRRDRRLDYTRVSMTRALRYHFSGIAGAGMNPLARLMRARGHDVQGSDRSLDHG